MTLLDWPGPTSVCAGYVRYAFYWVKQITVKTWLMQRALEAFVYVLGACTHMQAFRTCLQAQDSVKRIACCFPFPASLPAEVLE